MNFRELKSFLVQQSQMKNETRQLSLDYRPDIDGLRGIAVLAVVGFHASPSNFRGGFIGVDVFFVISGFLITGLILGQLELHRFSLAEFYARRIRRLFPALIAVMLVVWVAGWRFLLVDEYQLLGKHIAASAAFVPNVVFWNEINYFDVEAGRKQLLHLWSLGVEEQYYLVWPALVYLFLRYRFFLPGVAVLFLLSFAANVVLTRQSPDAAFYLPHTRFWELLTGSLLAIVGVSRNAAATARLPRPVVALCTPNATPAINDVKSLAGLILILASISLIRRGSAFPGWWALLPTLGAALVISAGPEARINRFILAHPIMVLAGLISYPLYLWHWPLLSLAYMAEGGHLTKFVKFAAVGAAFPLAWLTYRFIEQPVRFGVRARRLKTALLIVAMILMGALGLWTYRNEGFPSRFPDEIVKILRHPYEIRTEYRHKKCFLAERDQTEYADECLDKETSPPRPLVFLWGDSHAAHLYPGLKELQNKLPFRLAQFTGCELLDEPRLRHCLAINEKIRKVIAQERPKIVILAMRWSQYTGSLDDSVAKLVSFLRSNGVAKIFLVGPPPQWKPDLKTALAYFYLAEGKLPDRMEYGLVNFDRLVRQDQQLSRLAKELGVNHLSAINALCTKDGCITRVGATPDGLIAADSDHYPRRGSIYFLNAVASDLEAAIKQP
jgi:peptidoglycan/LPS O-acetylase OafA/YrhL